MADKIKFGTDGWRAIIADTYTVSNVKRIAKATADWVKTKSDTPSIVLGYDCRFGGYLFAETVIDVMAAEGVKVYFDKHFVSTPMISLAANKLQSTAGVILTASHNPPSYNGYKLKSNFGGPTIPEEIQAVEDLIEESYDCPKQDWNVLESKGLLELMNFEDMYYDHVVAHFDMEAIRQSKFTLAYDAMYGAGQDILPRLLPNAATLHCDYNPGFKGQAPEPIHKNLGEFSELIVEGWESRREVLHRHCPFPRPIRNRLDRRDRQRRRPCSACSRRAGRSASRSALRLTTHDSQCSSGA